MTLHMNMIHSKIQTRRWLWGLFSAFLLFGSCLYPAQVFKYKTNSPTHGYLIRGVPYEKWLKRNYCGPACLAMIFNYWDGTSTVSQQRITDDIYDRQNQATYNSELVWYPRRHGYDSYSFQGSLQILKDVLSQGIPVIVLTKTIRQIRKGHYRVVIGYDEDKGQIIFHDPYFGARQAMKTKLFMKVWELGRGRNQSRWMMAILPQHSIFPFPALQNDPLTAINLATAYYRRSDFINSRAQWEIAEKLLADDPYPLFSLAMVSLKENKAEEAEAYAIQATGLDDNSAYAHDVLGLAYARQGKIVQAFQSLEKAVRLAPKEDFIRQHYLQVRGLYLNGALLEKLNYKGDSK